MKAVLQNQDVGLRPTQVGDLQAIVVLDDFDQPIAVCLQPKSGVLWWRTVEDKDFAKLVEDLGLLKRKTDVKTIQQLAAT
jgi:hypothetical protein